MLLAIDSGNTNVVFAVYDGDAKRAQWRASSDHRRTADEYGVWLTHLFDHEGLATDQIDGAILANVVPALNHALTELCIRYFGTSPMRIGDPGVDLGVAVRIDRPDQVGADRLVNTVSTFERYGGPAIVIDFGSATTFDVVGPDGAYEGGVIAPAAQHSVEALYRVAAQLPRVAIEPPEQVIGKATVPAMKSGVYWGYVSLIEGLVARIKAEYGQAMTVVATGGLAALYSEATDAIEHLDSDLTMRGLVTIYHRNSTKGRG